MRKISFAPAILLASTVFACQGSEPTFTVSHFADSSGSLSFAQIRNGNFTPLRTTTPSYPASATAHWFRLDVVGAANWDWLEIDYAQLDRIEVHIPAPGSRRMVAGDSFPFADRAVPLPTFLFPLKRAAMEATTLFVRVQTSGPILIPFALHTDASLQRNSLRAHLLWGAFCGLLLIMSLYNLLLFFAIRDRTFLWYAAYVLLLMLGFISLEGYAYAYIWPKWVWWHNRSFTVLAGLSYFCAIAFARRFLALDLYAPLLNRLLYGAGGLLVAAELVPLFGPYRLGATLVNLLVVVVAFLLLLAGIFAARGGSKPALIFLAAWSLLICGTIASILMFTGVLPPAAKHVAITGAALEAVLISLGLGYRFRVLQEEKAQAQRGALERQKALTSSFARFVPKEFLKFLGKDDITDVRLGDAVEKEMTVLFSDIRGYATLSERMSPTENFEFLNAVLKRIGPLIRENGGFIDKYIGDAIMALFPADPEDALNAAIGMRRLLAIYNTRRAAKGYAPIEIGIGLHTGRLMLGTIGEEERMEGTVISDAVNLASRLESLTKQYGATIVMSEQTLFRIPDPSRYSVRILDHVRVKGKAEQVSVAEILDGEATESVALKMATLRQFERGISAYLMRDFSTAAEHFRAVLRQNPGDTAAVVHLRRCEHFAAHGAPPEWQGITDLTDK